MIYTQRQNLAASIINKLKAGKPLTKEETQYVNEVLEDPLQEFCMREGTFRLKEMFGLPEKDADELEDAAGSAIRDEIDNCETLYDYLDEDLDSVLTDNGYEHTGVGWRKEELNNGN